MRSSLSAESMLHLTSLLLSPAWESRRSFEHGPRWETVDNNRDVAFIDGVAERARVPVLFVHVVLLLMHFCAMFWKQERHSPSPIPFLNQTKIIKKYVFEMHKACMNSAWDTSV